MKLYPLYSSCLTRFSTKGFLRSIVYIVALFITITALNLSPTHSYAYELPSSPTSKVTPDPYLQRLSSALSKLTERSKKALVFISTTTTVDSSRAIDPFEFFFGPMPDPRQQPRRQDGIGSGFFVDVNNGYILTNNHVVDNTDKITIKIASGTTYEGEVVGRDSNTDVAVVKISEKGFDRNEVSQLTLFEGGITPGELTIALGAPFNLEASVSLGIVSATKRNQLRITTLGSFIQTDAAINPGNSGGPLLNMAGQVIGMNTAIVSRSGSSAGVGFAIPAQLARLVAQKLINDGKLERGFLGIHMQEVTPQIAKALGLAKNQTGALVTHVVDGPAKAAGILPNDLIVALNKKPVNNTNELMLGIGTKSPGTEVLVTIVRDGKRKNLKLTLSNWPEELASGTESSPLQDGKKNKKLGLALKELSALPAQTKRALKNANLISTEGLIVTSIKADSLAEKAELKINDVILSVNKVDVTTVSQFEKVISAKNTTTLLLRIERQGVFMYISIDLES